MQQAGRSHLLELTDRGPNRGGTFIIQALHASLALACMIHTPETEQLYKVQDRQRRRLSSWTEIPKPSSRGKLFNDHEALANLALRRKDRVAYSLPKTVLVVNAQRLPPKIS